MRAGYLSRRQFLQGTVLIPFLAHYHLLAAPEKKRYKIRDVQTMFMQGSRTYLFVKIVADAGLYGIGEAYGSPGVGVREQIHSLKDWLVGKDPLHAARRAQL
jgi:L-alanine-DL-glutamate epimerase-like enolase superfamily enzyme